MTIEVFYIHDDSNVVLVDKLKFALSEITDKNIITNYHPDYAESPGNLFNILKNGRYREGFGKYFIILDDGEYVSSAGWNEYELDPTTALLITRLYIKPNRRAEYHIGKLVLPVTIQETLKYQRSWITMNEYNYSLYKWFMRTNNKAKPKPDELLYYYRIFKPIGMHKINYTDQYVVELDRSIYDK